jgi:hypothetical protein
VQGRIQQIKERLLGFTSDDNVELFQKKPGFTSGQGTPGDEQGGLLAQVMGEPQAIVDHSHHAVDPNHICPDCQGPIQGFLPFEKSTINQGYGVSGFPQAGSNVTNAKRREAKYRTVPTRLEKGIDQQD